VDPPRTVGGRETACSQRGRKHVRQATGRDAPESDDRLGLSAYCRSVLDHTSDHQQLVQAPPQKPADLTHLASIIHKLPEFRRHFKAQLVRIAPL